MEVVPTIHFQVIFASGCQFVQILFSWQRFLTTLCDNSTLDQHRWHGFMGLNQPKIKQEWEQTEMIKLGV